MNKITEIKGSSRHYYESVQEFVTEIMTVQLDGVCEGYELDCIKVESGNTEGIIWYECSPNFLSCSAGLSSTNVYETKEEMMDFINGWVDELNSK